MLLPFDDTTKGDLTIFWELFTVIPCEPKHLSYACLVHCKPITHGFRDLSYGITRQPKKKKMFRSLFFVSLIGFYNGKTHNNFKVKEGSNFDVILV